MRKFVRRNKRSLTDVTGYVDLPSACIRANQTGFFGLSQRVYPESFDGKDTNIDPRDCFFGGRRIDLAVGIKYAEDLATKSAGTDADNSSKSDASSASGQQE